ncbi:MAG: hypothetical protein IK990_01520 [Ruminiclostridium sp.]|nr:hypothetical protein [Ruminiclostridium sp.]
MNAIEELEQLNEIKQYKQNNKLVAIVKTESFYHLALSNISYAEKAISEYASYSEIVKTEEVVMFYYALCLELTGDIAKAIDVYQKLNWKSNPVIAEEYMMACVFSGDYNSVISSYNDLTEVNKTVALCSLYLFSLSKNNDSSFKIKIKELIEAHNDRLSDLVEIAKYNSEGNIIQKLLIPAINRTLNEKSLNELSIIQLNELIIFMSRNRQIELIEKIITNIIDLSVLNLVTLNEIYKVFFEVANREYSNPQNDFIKPNDFESVDKMSSMLLDHNVGKKYFLQIKVMCSIAQQLPFSTLKYSQELFEITRDAETAHKVVLSLINCKETSDEKYSKYIEAIKDSNNPNVCLAIANAKIICGNETEAEYYLYKSLYLLNGNDDYNILRDYFSICVGYFQGLHDDKPLDTIKGKCVLFLENIDNSKVIEVILDSEPEFSDEFNKSMDVEHIPLSSPDYAKLYSCGPRQIVKFHNKKYRIVSIMSRMQYGYRYIFRKLQENPGEFKGTAWVISADNPEEMIDKMKSIMDNTDHINSLLSLYHLEQNDIGLPIDSLSSGDYNKYIHSLKYLLYGNNQALYAGQVMYNSTYKKYVPDISTIALLATLGSLDIIDEIKKDIVIPQSYLDFVKIHYLQSKQDANANVTTLSFVDGKPTMYEFDKSISEIWELMYDFCFSCEKETVSNQERIACNVDGNLSLEKLLVGFKLSMVHLDAIALTRKQNAAFVCDDLFFRKISTIMKIANVNIASLAYSASKWDFLLNLSKTNYIYVPIRARDNNMMKELIHNLMNGEKKKLYYGSLINMMQKAWLNIIKTLQNNE